MKRMMLIALAVLACSCFAAAISPPATAVATRRPDEKQEPYWAGKGFWNRRHAAKLAEIAAGPKEYDCVFVGDSITHNWEGWSDPVDVVKVTHQYEIGKLKFPNGPGRKVWDEMKTRYRLLNLGIGGDSTQYVLWRLENGEMDGYRARCVMLMIGANNYQPVDDVVAGIKACVDKIAEKQPQAKILLSPIFPSRRSASDPRRLFENRVNAAIRHFADGKKVVWVDFNAQFLEPDGTLTPEMMPDYLHPLEQGYRIWQTAVEPYLVKAENVWVKGAEKEMNAFYGFAATFKAKPGDSPVLTLSAGSIARVWMNGMFAGYGPARAAEGYMRLDEWPLAKFVKDGVNLIAIEVSNPAVNQFYLPERPAYLFAEVALDGKALAVTGRDFRAVNLPRVRKTNRFSYQRGFAEFYAVSPESYAWRTHGVEGSGLELEVRPQLKMLGRGAPYPDFAFDGTFRPVSRTVMRRDPERKVKSVSCVEKCGVGTLKGFKRDDLAVNMADLQYFVPSSVVPAGAGPAFGLKDGEGVVFNGDHTTAGFPRIELTCRAPAKLWLVFDEFPGKDGLPNPVRFHSCVGACGWKLEKPGEYALECFQAYGLGCAHVFIDGGEVKIRRFDVRTYVNPEPARASFRCSDAAFDKIFAAAARTLAHNAVDLFIDCPGRERGAYFGDTIFTGRAGDVLLGDHVVERSLFENYALAAQFKDVPEGMIPMCYPADVVLSEPHWIPNFGLWSVIELAEYIKRSGDTGMAELFRSKAEGLLAWFRKSRNADGLLENLPGWVFIEWSKAAQFVKGISYATNMTYAKFLDAFAEVYGRKDCAEEAERVREAVRAQSWNGEWFRDNAVRRTDGTLEFPGDCSEACQYFAFFSGTATKERYPVLWTRVIGELGPKRAEGVWPKIWPSNMLFGYSLRFGILTDAGLAARALDEVKVCYLPMAERTGTLWENVNVDSGYSADHGFAAQAAWVLVRNALGVVKLDRESKTIVVSPSAELPLEWAEGTIPVSPKEAVTVKWRKVNGVPVVETNLPKEWNVAAPRAE